MRWIIISIITFAFSITCQGNDKNFLDYEQSSDLKEQIFYSLEQSNDWEFREAIEDALHSEVGYDEAEVIQDILQLFADKYSFRHVLEGAHVRINDNGFYYAKWESLPSARARISSHPSVEGLDQYGIAGPISHEILFGIIEVEGVIMTFFQWENTPWAEGWKNRLGHTLDAVQYIFTRKNIGPYGTSVHTDKNPILL